MPKLLHAELRPRLQGSSNLSKVQQALTGAGYLAWLAGGCVRDALLGLKPRDFDLVTDASVAQLSQVFPGAILVGAQFGVVRVIQGGEEFEIAQFRQESDYRDGRRPQMVEPATAAQDAWRRDLTVNALFFDPATNKIHDFVQGLPDLELGILRAVGSADVRFAEDHLRILRAIRFRAQLGFTWEPALLRAIEHNKHLLALVSRERVRDEVLKMTLAEHWLLLPEFLVDLQILPILFEGVVWQAKAHVVLDKKNPEAVWWEWGLWILRSGQTLPKTFEALVSLRLTNNEKRSCQHFLFWFDPHHDWHSLSLAQILINALKPGGREGLTLWFQLNPLGHPRQDQLTSLLAKWSEKPEPWIRAEHLPGLSGPELGRALQQAYHRQLEGLDVDQAAALAFCLAGSR